MTDILGIGSSGLTAYRKLLETTGNNITNANTQGYVRRDVVLASMGEAQMLPTTKIAASGSGVSVDLVRRASDAFLQSQVRNALAREAKSQVLAEGLVKLEKAVIAPEHNIGSTVQEFFAKVQDLTLSPSSTSMRLTLIDAGQRVAERFRVTASNIRDEITSSEASMKTTIDAMNSISAQLASLNREIIRSGSGPQKLNDLLDQRDKLLTDIAKLANVTVTEKSTGEIALYLGDSPSGPQLINFDRSFDIGMEVDGDRVDIIYDPYGSGSLTNQLTSGAIAGQRNFRAEALKLLANVNRLAVGFADAVNTQHKQGIDLKGVPGKELFSTESIVAEPAKLNRGSAKVNVQIEAAADLTAGTYTLRYDKINDQWSVRSDATGASTFGMPPLRLEGLAFSVEGVPFDGDVFLTQPLADAALGMHFLTDDPAAIAASMPLYVDASPNNSASGELSLNQWAIKVPAPSTPPSLLSLFDMQNGDTLAFRRDGNAFTIPSGARNTTLSSVGNVSAAHFTPELFNIAPGSNSGSARLNVKSQSTNFAPNGSYQARFDGTTGQWSVTSDDTGKAIKGTAAVIIDGNEFTFTGNAADGDTFRIEAFPGFGKRLQTEIKLNLELSNAEGAIAPFALNLKTDDRSLEGIANAINEAAFAQNYSNAVFASVANGTLSINGLSDYVIQSASLSGKDSNQAFSSIAAAIEKPLEGAQIQILTTEGRELLTSDMAGWRGVNIQKHVSPVEIEPVVVGQQIPPFSCVIKVQGEPLRDAPLKGDDGSVVAGGVYALDLAGARPIRLAGRDIEGKDNNGIIDCFFDHLNQQAALRSWSGKTIDFSKSAVEKVRFRITIDGEANDVTFVRAKNDQGLLLSTGRFDIDGPTPLNLSIVSDGEPKGHLVFTLPKKIGTKAPDIEISGAQASDLGLIEPLKARITASGKLMDGVAFPQSLRVQVGDAQPTNVLIHGTTGSDASGVSWSLVDGRLMIEALSTSINVVPSNEVERDSAARLGFLATDLNVSKVINNKGEKSLQISSSVASSSAFANASASISRIGTTIRFTDEVPEDLIVVLKTLNADSQRVISARFPADLVRQEPKLGDLDVRVVDNSHLEITDAISGHVVATRTYVVGEPLQYLGLNFTLKAPITTGDRFKIRWDDSRTGDNRNIVAMTQLQEDDIFGEKRGSFQDVYSATAAKLGNTSQSAATDMGIAGKAASDLQSVYDAKTGVSLDKEASDLIRYQQAYQAAAQVVSTARTMFDTILKII